MTRALDLSPEYCCGAVPVAPLDSMIDCAERNGYGRIFVGASYSAEAVVQQYLNAIERKLASGVYGFVHWDDSYKLHIDNALRHVIANHERYMLLDVELGDPYSMDPAFVIARVWWAVNYCRSYGVEPIIYTGPWWWNPATNNSQETFGCMAVLAEYVHDPDVPPGDDDIAECGGWSIVNGNIYGHQYAGTVDTCGMNTDRIRIIKEAQMAFDAKKRATQDQAVRLLAGDALNDSMASLVNRLQYFGVLPPGSVALKEHLVTEV